MFNAYKVNIFSNALYTRWDNGDISDDDGCGGGDDSSDNRNDLLTFLFVLLPLKGFSSYFLLNHPPLMFIPTALSSFCLFIFIHSNSY